MKVYVTGARGFVGRWLIRELERTGHKPLTSETHDGQRLDVRDADAVARVLHAFRPDAVIHLAAVSAASDAAAQPEEAFAVTVGGTVNLLEAARTLPERLHVVVVGSSEVYGAPHATDIPLRESAPLRPRTPYALSKVAQESVALAYAARYGMSLTVARAFNHTGPGQRPAFVVPAIAGRVRELRDGHATDIPVGNLDVCRDFTDVRDVARAYRLLLEALAGGRIPAGSVFNVASGESVAISWIVELLAQAAGVDAVTRTDPDLVRHGDPPDVRGDPSALRAATGWQPEFPLAETLRDVWLDVAGMMATQHLA